MFYFYCYTLVLLKDKVNLCKRLLCIHLFVHLFDNKLGAREYKTIIKRQKVTN